MKNIETLSVIISIPDLHSKTKLREVLRSFIYKGELGYERSIKDLDVKLDASQPGEWDVVFISSKYASKDISEFLGRMSARPIESRPAVVIALTQGASQQSGTVATWYLEGVSGFISDPYTSDDLIQLLTTILNQKNNPSPPPGPNAQKTRKAAEFLMTDAMGLIDEIARLAFEGKEGGYPLRDLKTLAKNFPDFYSQDPEGFENALVETFQRAKPPAWAKGNVKSKAKSKVVKHPGLVVWELMTQRELTAERLTGLLRIEEQEVAALTRGQLDVTPELAQNLSRALGMSAREWMKMQAEYDAYKAKSGPTPEKK